MRHLLAPWRQGLGVLLLLTAPLLGRAQSTNRPDDTNWGPALAHPHQPTDSAAHKPADMNYVRTWLPRVPLTAAAATDSVAPNCAATGYVLREAWDNVPGALITDLPPLSQAPSSLTYLTALEVPLSWQENCGDRLRGFLCPPQTGTYTFWIAGDDASELWLSPDADPTHARRIAFVSGNTDPRQWDKNPSQQAAGQQLVAGQTYYLEVRHKNGYGQGHVSVAWRLPSGLLEAPLAGSHLRPAAPQAPPAGGVLREQWNPLPGAAVAQLPLASPPTSARYQTTLATPPGYGTQYGSRTSAYLVPPQTGAYTFWVAGDDQAELWLSPDSLPAHRVRRARLTQPTSQGQWFTYPEQQSDTLHLVAGHRYYVELLHKQDGGADHVEVAWRRPDGSFEATIPSTSLAPAPAPQPTAPVGGLRRAQWNNVFGGVVSQIPLASPPISVGYPDSFEGPTNVGDNFGDRLSGYLLAPQTGTYTLSVAGDDQCELWLSPDADSTHIQLLAGVPDYTSIREWDKYPAQQAGTAQLVAGQRYYVELRHAQGGGYSHEAVAWRLPDGTFEGPIPGSRLSPAWTPITVTGKMVARSSQWTADSAQVTTQYLDGLGRPVQTVLHQASPQRRDLVQPQAYDGLDREPRQYLPYPADSGAVGSYRHRALSQQQDFYARTGLAGGAQGPPTATDATLGVARTGVAYAETQFEASPLNRVLAQGAAGEAWQLGAGHAPQRLERPNTAADSVLRFAPGYDPQSLDPGYQGFYAAGELWGTQTTDEHGGRTIAWKDKLNQVVLKQVEISQPDTSRTAARRWLRTAYVYDDFQHLRFVLQPLGVRALLAAGPAAPVGPAVDPVSRGLQVWLPLDETQGSQAVDASGNNRHAALYGGTWQPTGGHDGHGALQLLDGQFAQVPLTWQPRNYSVAFWMKPTRRFDYSQTMAAPAWGTFAFHSTVSGEVYVGTDVATRIHIGTPNTVEQGTWQHFVFTFESGVGVLYKNGQVLATQGGMTLPDPWQGLNLGASGDELYDEVRVYNRPLDPTEVTALYQLRTPLPAPTLASFLFHYRYDGRGRQIAKQVPGQDGETLVVYDQLDRPVLSQDAQQRTRKEWSWTKYDALGRVVLSGLVSRADTMGQVRLQAIATADTATAHQYEQRTTNAATQYYSTDHAFPQLGQQGFGAGQVLSATYYDDYDFDNDGTADLAYDPSTDGQFASGQAPVADALRTNGLSTRTKTRVLGVAASDVKQTDWLTTTTFYDERARPVQVQTTNARKDSISGKPFVDLLTTQLDFTGKVVQSVAVHQGPHHAPVTVAEFFRYDHTGRLLATRQQLPGEARPTRLDSVQYNEIGQAVRKTLGTGRLAQEVKYAYNIRGWLTKLNDPAQPDPADLFNLSLHYETGFTRGFEQYNGNLTGQTWRGRDGVQRAYGYAYDPANRLLQGDFVARAGGRTGTLITATPWNQEQNNYGLSFVSYDDNGNINTLRRRGLWQNATHTTAKQYGAVDNLTYAYVGNRLQAVDDQVTGNQLAKPASYHGAPTSLAGDFQEAGVQQSQEYLYDANGNLTQDKNKGITGIAYNHLNLPRQIHFGQVGDSVVFRYTASGKKVAKLVYQTGKHVQRTDYLGPYQYEQDSLKFFPHSEGRVLRFVSYDPAGQASIRYQREFTMKDHLGNLRLAYRLGQVRTLTATLEQDKTTHDRESQQFDSLSVSAPVAVQTPYAHGAGSWAARLNAGGSTPQPLGPLTQLGVQKGDTVTVQAFGYYAQATQHGFLFSLGAFLANLFHPTQAPPSGQEAQRRKGFPLLQVGVAAGLASIPQLSGGVPRGYLRVLIFNRDSALVRQRTWQLSQGANGSYEPLGDTVRISQDGYVTVYVGNESDVDVLFDDVSVQHRQGLQVQETQYDPAGLELAGLAPPSPGICGLNNYRFNGKEFQADLGLNWNHQDWRFFDPQILRWHVGDPEIENGQESWTPYSFGYDNAVRYGDADGQEPGPGDIFTSVVTFSNGLTASLANNFSGGIFNTRELQSRNIGSAQADNYNAGQKLGDGLSAVGGTLITAAAVVEAFGVGAGTFLSGGTAAPGAIALTPGIIAQAGYGAAVVRSAYNNAKDENGRVNAKGKRPANRTADNTHGNKLGDQPAEGYSLRDADNGDLQKFGETTKGERQNGAGNQKRYSGKELERTNSVYQKEVEGTKRDMHKWQTQQIRDYKSNNGGKRPPLNKSDY